MFFESIRTVNLTRIFIIYFFLLGAFYTRIIWEMQFPLGDKISFYIFHFSRQYKNGTQKFLLVDNS